jgi:hypothetical protein
MTWAIIAFLYVSGAVATLMIEADATLRGGLTMRAMLGAAVWPALVWMALFLAVFGK